ncbi:MAG: PaaI family thioesterase [Cyanobacteria bacterium SZAS LIN-2]|nr:PaaI family thioesterase [Cyanobacteria bacterium SZAS LIN-3]MBS1999245.1 PaaI family thioesterase [Cyanobacteria bacterium SZAS LIN-2]
MSARKYPWNALTAIGGTMLEVRDGYAKAQLPLSAEVMQPVSVYHAGAIVTLADEAASAAIWGGGFEPASDIKDAQALEGKKFPYSVQLSVNLLTNDPVGPITAEAKVLKRGRLTVVDTEVRTSDGTLMTTMRSTHMMVDASKVGPHLRGPK